MAARYCIKHPLRIGQPAQVQRAAAERHIRYGFDVEDQQVHRSPQVCRRGRLLGTEDHVVQWRKPTAIRSLDREAYHALPAFITVREARVRVAQPGFRPRSLVVVTTLLDPRQVTKADLAALYRARWNVELDLRAIKVALQMDQLRCKAPELVRKEVWSHVLAYNLLKRSTIHLPVARSNVGGAESANAPMMSPPSRLGNHKG